MGGTSLNTPRAEAPRRRVQTISVSARNDRQTRGANARGAKALTLPQQFFDDHELADHVVVDKLGRRWSVNSK